MPAEKALNRICNVWRSAVLHENCAIHTCTLLKYGNYVVAQKRFIAYTSDGAGNRTHMTYLFGKEWPYDERCRKSALHSYFFRMKRYWLMSERISLCPYFAILSIDICFDMEMNFICPKKCSIVSDFTYSDV
ncbi:hypothetical protein AVEN_195786-1 [Araneus ventricosus]|uniref:Uncharacterized protein n=1 Tax=Araneus ventricosus TaxID=182803 RepID=A0A4Y2JF95_ARAVE|nr:hypothetical protein AVEN_195786-1 [Araneus ventricosus]